MSHAFDTTGAVPTTKILALVEQRIQCRLSGRVRDFRLSFGDDGLILEGHTHTYYTKQLAQHAVMEAVDLPICANRIRVV